MKRVTLDGAALRSRAQLHECLAAGLCLPDWYGKNLDALADCLTGPGEALCITLRHRRAMEENLGARYTEALTRLLRRAAAGSLRVTVYLLP